jgi:peroxiredoxin
MIKGLTIGDIPPAFQMPNLRGEITSLEEFRGRWLLLSFYRYASCPLCNLRVHELSELHAEWQAKGLEMLAIFQSPVEKLNMYVGSQQLPFALIPDPGQVLYKSYGVDHSWMGFLLAWVKRLPEISLAVLRERFLPGSIEGGIHRIPADFLINPDGCITEAYYGRDIGDHLPIAKIKQYLQTKAGS